MTWFKIDDGFHSHPKVLRLLTEFPRQYGNALALWLRCGSHVANYQQDGYIPATTAKLLCNEPRAIRKLACCLVVVGLWEECDGGWRFKDWLDYNPSAEEQKTSSKSNAERQSRFRDSKKADRNALRERYAGDPVTPPRPDPIDKNNVNSYKSKSARAYSNAPEAQGERKAEHEKESSIDSIASAFSEARKAACGVPYKRQLSDYNGLLEAVDIFQECAKNMGTDAATLARRSADNFCAQKWAQEHDYPIRAWLKDPARNLSNNKAVDPTAGMTPREKWEYENLRG